MPVPNRILPGQGCRTGESTGESTEFSFAPACKYLTVCGMKHIAANPSPASRIFGPAKAVFLAFVLALALIGLAFAGTAQAAERDRVEAFLNVTGFDVALDSIALTAEAAPDMLGIDASDFGANWNRLTQEVFDTAVMRNMALDILEQTLSDELLAHAAGFYASDLGRRLVVAENAAHMQKDESVSQTEGMQIVADLVQQGSSRLALLRRMGRAIDVADTSLRALQEIQMRFLLAASAAGVIDLEMDRDGLRAFLKSQEGQLRRAIRQSALIASAYTYRDFSDADVLAYVEALEEPRMRQVYELLNAVQYEIMANRFEVLAARMAELEPGQDI
jgi:Uncharacterized protein conserved in bacteria (DUF2059)